jgi:hypothetical protein
MAGPSQPEPEVEQQWYAPLIGLAFVILVVGSLALATLAVYD